MFFSDSLSKNTPNNIQNIVIVNFCSIFFSIFYRNAKIPTSCTAKSRHVGENRMSNDHSHHLCISKFFFCNALFNVTINIFLGLSALQISKSKLQQFYARKAGAPIADVFGEPIEDLSLKDIFVDLYLVKASLVEKEWREKSEFLEHLELYNKQMGLEKIELSDIITDKDTHVLLGGIAGEGKTVLSTKICSDWSSGTILSDCHYVFLITAREMNFLQQNQPDKLTSLYDVVTHFYPEQLHGVTRDEFQSVIARTLLIFDGLDELASLETVFKGTEMSSFESLIYDLILSRENQRNLITGRPQSCWMAQNMYLKHSIQYRKVETLGFSSENVSLYVQKFFGADKEKFANKLLKAIKAQPQVASMVSVPVILHMTCSIFKAFPNIDVPKTVTELYVHGSVTFLRNHSRLSRGKSRVMVTYALDNEEMELLLTMAGISFVMLESGVVVIKYDEKLDKRFFEPSGYLIMYVIHGQKVVMYRHLTQQEFFCALHIVAEDIPLKSIKDNPSLTGVIHLVSGLQGAALEDSNSSPYVVDFVKAIKSYAEDRRYQKLSILLRGVSILSKKVKKPVDKRELVRDTHFIYQLFSDIGCSDDGLCVFFEQDETGSNYSFLMSLYEYQNITVEFLKQLQPLDIQFSGKSGSLTSYILQYLLRKYSEHNVMVNHLTFKNCESSDYSALFPTLPSVDKLTLWDSNFSDEDLLTLSQCLMTKVVNTLVLGLRVTDHHLKEISLLIPGVEYFSLSDQSFTFKGLEYLSKAITKRVQTGEQIRLKSIEMQDCNLNDNFLPIFGRMICNLDELNIGSNTNFTQVGFQNMLDEVLNSEQELRLNALKLPYCGLDEPSFSTLMELFPRLEKIDLSGNRVTQLVCNMLVQGLIHSPFAVKLKYLILETCEIDDHGLIVLAKIIFLMKEVYIGWNAFTEEGLEEVIKKLEKHRKKSVLSLIDIQHCNLSHEDVDTVIRPLQEYQLTLQIISEHQNYNIDYGVLPM